MNKYKNRECEYRGVKFKSVKEMERYIILLDKEKNGKITNLEVQKKYELIPKVPKKFRALSYYADFVYNIPGYENKFVEDVKGYCRVRNKNGKWSSSSAYNLFVVKKKLMYYIHGIEVIEV